MKRTAYPLILSLTLLGCAAQAATIYKANNNDALNLTSSWDGGSVPGGGDAAHWDASSANGSFDFTSNLTWGSMRIQTDAPTGTYTIDSSNGSTLSFNGSNSVRVNGGTDQARTLNLNSDIILNSNVTFLAHSHLATLAINGDINNSGHQVTLTLNEDSGFLQVNGVISGTGGLLRENNGNGHTLLAELTAVNTYTGNTSITRGTLRLGAEGSIASSPQIYLGLGINNNSYGVLDTTAQSFTMLASQTINFGVTGYGANDGYAGILDAGDLDISNGAVSFTVDQELDDESIVIANYTSLTGSSFGSISNLPDGYEINYNFGGGNQIALVVAVPEPSLFALLSGLGVLALCRYRRR